MAFRSGLEEKVADLLVDLGVKYEYESTKVDYVISHIYTPDFVLPNGVVLECKGYWDAADRRKIKTVKQQHKLGKIKLDNKQQLCRQKNDDTGENLHNFLN